MRRRRQKRGKWFKHGRARTSTHFQTSLHKHSPNCVERSLIRQSAQQKLQSRSNERFEPSRRVKRFVRSRASKYSSEAEEELLMACVAVGSSNHHRAEDGVDHDPRNAIVRKLGGVG